MPPNELSKILKGLRTEKVKRRLREVDLGAIEQQLRTKGVAMLPTKEGSHECIFLVSDGKSKTCAIHEYRPSCCSHYPVDSYSHPELDIIFVDSACPNKDEAVAEFIRTRDNKKKPYVVRELEYSKGVSSLMIKEIYEVLSERGLKLTAVK